MLIMSYIGDHVWLITSRQTEPELMGCKLALFRIKQDSTGALQFIDVGMEYTVDKSNTWTLVWVLIWQLYVDFPETTGKWRCIMVSDTIIDHNV